MYFVDFHSIKNTCIHVTTTELHTCSCLHIWDMSNMCVCWPIWLYVQGLPSVTVCMFTFVALHVYMCGCVCLSVCLDSYLLQIASASSEPSAHSGSPSQRHLAGTHCPFLQAKSVVAHVFFAVETKEASNIKSQPWLPVYGRLLILLCSSG